MSPASKKGGPESRAGELRAEIAIHDKAYYCLLYTSPSPRDS